MMNGGIFKVLIDSGSSIRHCFGSDQRTDLEGELRNYRYSRFDAKEVGETASFAAELAEMTASDVGIEGLGVAIVRNLAGAGQSIEHLNSFA